MALSANTVWEVRTTGSQNNGGGFVTGASGTDYSQQAAAQYALNPVTSGGASAVMTNANAAAAMVGNICRVVSGTNATAGWYQIISVNVGVDITVDRNWCTGACADGVVNVGGAFKFGGTLDDDFTEAQVAGNVIYIKSGTYTIGENIAQTTDGSLSNPIWIIGYTTVRNDVCVGDDRPFFVCNNYQFFFGDYLIHKNLRITSAYTNAYFVGQYNLVYNCKSVQTGAATRQAFVSTGRATFIACEAVSTNGEAFSLPGLCKAISCYVHDSAIGFKMTGQSNAIIGTVIEACTTGVVTGGFEGLFLLNNTIYNCTVGIPGTTAAWNCFLNNIITDCATGASWTSSKPIDLWDYNCWNNTVDCVNVTKGPHDITADPKLKDPANGDFTLKSGSPCFGAGLSLSSDVGLA